MVKNAKDKSTVAVLYVDLHPREGKRNGAWMTSYKSQSKDQNTNNRPHVSIVCNFTRPTESSPSLLTFQEVTTLFHEFGHALHGMLANTKYGSLSGTSVAWDFVELPSQILENWCFEKEALALFAQHHITGEDIPTKLVEKIKASSNFMQGYQTIRQVSFGLLDMSWHHSFNQCIDIKAHEKEVFEQKLSYSLTKKKTACLPLFPIFFREAIVRGTTLTNGQKFWMQTLLKCSRKMAYSINQQLIYLKNIFYQKVAPLKQKTFTRKFRGRKPNPEALLKRAGLIK